MNFCKPFWHHLTPAILVLVGSSLFSCATPNSTSPVVVERSKEEPPAWASSSVPAVLNSDANEFTFLLMREKLLNLPLGIKQSQLGALEASQRALEDFVRSKVVELARTRNVHIGAAAGELDREISRSSQKFHTQFAQIKDLYFEKLTHEPSPGDGEVTESYRVFVLVAFPRHQISSLMADLTKRLSLSRDQGLRSLSLLIRQEEKQITSH